MSDAAEVQKTVRKYFMIGGLLLVFTGITVTANYLNFGVTGAIAVTLIIAAMKRSMVTSVFMHLSHEKQWIYGALLLTVVFFIVLMSVPIFTLVDTIGTHTPAVGITQAAGHEGGH